MDVVLSIFEQLGANSSLLYQFGIFCVLFVLSKVLFFNHLQSVIETREQKTVGLEGKADKQFEEVNKMSQDYKAKMAEAKKSVRERYDGQKTEIIKDLERKYRDEETKVGLYVEEERKKILADYSVKESEVLTEADQLANLLVKKVTRE